MAGGKASAHKLALADRRRLAVQLRKQGGTFRQIADQLKKQDGISPRYSATDAYDDVVHELKRINAEAAEDAEIVRRLELERLDEMWAALWTAFKQGDYAAFDRLMVIMNQRGRYLPVFDLTDRTTNLNLSGGVEVAGHAEMSDTELASKLLALVQGAVIAGGQEIVITDGVADRQQAVGGDDSGHVARTESDAEGMAA